MTLERPNVLPPIDNRLLIIRCGSCRSEDLLALEEHSSNAFSHVEKDYKCNNCGKEFRHYFPYFPYGKSVTVVSGGRKL